MREGLPQLRREWILKRGDVEEYEGREILPQDNGYLTKGAEEFAKAKPSKDGTQNEGFSGFETCAFESESGKNVSQMYYARRGIITPEMEYVAIRENLGRQIAFEKLANELSEDRSSLVSSAQRRIVRRERSRICYAGICAR